MSKIFCNTSPLQYLHQLELLHILPALMGNIIVPPAVVKELEVGKTLGLSLPNLNEFNWITVRQPVSLSALPLVIKPFRKKNAQGKLTSWKRENKVRGTLPTLA